MGRSLFQKASECCDLLGPMDGHTLEFNYVTFDVLHTYFEMRLRDHQVWPVSPQANNVIVAERWDYRDSRGFCWNPVDWWTA